jgi:hypothetical protein
MTNKQEDKEEAGGVVKNSTFIIAGGYSVSL